MQEKHLNPCVISPVEIYPTKPCHGRKMQDHLPFHFAGIVSVFLRKWCITWCVCNRLLLITIIFGPSDRCVFINHKYSEQVSSTLVKDRCICWWDGELGETVNAEIQSGELLLNGIWADKPSLNANRTKWKHKVLFPWAWWLITKSNKQEQIIPSWHQRKKSTWQPFMCLLDRRMADDLPSILLTSSSKAFTFFWIPGWANV